MSEKNEEAYQAYILRITKDEWVERVYEGKKYYVGIPRRWEAGLTVFIAYRTEKGDSLIGYGAVGAVKKMKDLGGEEREECVKHGARWILYFDKLVRFRFPLLIKDTVLKDVAVHGRYLHGFHLTDEQTRSILAQVDELNL